MNYIKQENLITNSRLEQRSIRNKNTKGAYSPFLNMSISYGLIAGVLMGSFLAFSGFYITGSQAMLGFAKYLILAIILGVLLNKVKIASDAGDTFKDGMRFGFNTTIVAAISTAVITILVNSLGSSTLAIQPDSSEVLGNFVLAGIAFFEGLVAGLILTFIWLQFLKDRQPAS